jgi:hypothetical protein
VALTKETAMRRESKVTQAGLDNHKDFSRLSARDAAGKIVFRRRLEHKDRGALREDLRRLPPGTPVVLEGTFGWGWMSEELKGCGLDPHLSSSRKVARPPRPGGEEGRRAGWSHKLQEQQMRPTGKGESDRERGIRQGKGNPTGKEIGKGKQTESRQVSRPGTGGPGHPMAAAAGISGVGPEL